MMVINECKYYANERGIFYSDPVRTRRWPAAGLMLVHRLRRWPNIRPAAGQRLVFTGESPRKFEVQYVQRARDCNYQ